MGSKNMPLALIRRSGQAVPTEDGKLLLHHAMNMEENMANSLIDAATGKLISRSFSYNPIRLKNYIYYFSAHPMAKCMDEIHFIMPLCDTLYSYPSFLPKYIVETPREMASKSQITARTDSYSKDIIALNRRGGARDLQPSMKQAVIFIWSVNTTGWHSAIFLQTKQPKKGDTTLAWKQRSQKFLFFTLQAHRAAH